MVVFKLRVDRKEKGIRKEGELDLNMHIDVLVGEDEDSLSYSGSLILWKDELKELITRIGAHQHNVVLTEDTPKEIRIALYGQEAY